MFCSTKDQRQCKVRLTGFKIPKKKFVQKPENDIRYNVVILCGNPIWLKNSFTPILLTILPTAFLILSHFTICILIYRSPPRLACWSGDQQGRFIPQDTIIFKGPKFRAEFSTFAPYASLRETYLSRKDAK